MKNIKCKKREKEKATNYQNFFKNAKLKLQFIFSSVWNRVPLKLRVSDRF